MSTSEPWELSEPQETMSKFGDNPLEDWIIVLKSSVLVPGPLTRVGRVSVLVPLDIDQGPVNCIDR